jgi:hypothetical protein
MPSRLIEDENGVMAGLDLGADFGEVGVHGVAIAIGHDHARGGPGLWADGSEEVGPLGALILRRRRTGSSPCPASGELVLLAYARFILPPEFDFGSDRERVFDVLDLCGKVFLKSSKAYSFWP